MSLAIYIKAAEKSKAATDAARESLGELADAIESSPELLAFQKSLDAVDAKITRIQDRLANDPKIRAASDAVDALAEETDRLRETLDADPVIRSLTEQLDELGKRRDALQARNDDSLELRERELAVRDAEERLNEIAKAASANGATPADLSALAAEKAKLLAELPEMRAKVKALAKEEESHHLSEERLAIEQEKIAIAAEKLQKDLDARQAIADAQIAKAEAKQKAAEDKLAALTAEGEKRIAELQKKETELQRKIDALEQTAREKATAGAEGDAEEGRGFFGALTSKVAEAHETVKRTTAAITDATGAATRQVADDAGAMVRSVADAAAGASDVLSSLLNFEQDTSGKNLDLRSFLRGDQQKGYAEEIGQTGFAGYLDEIARIFAYLAKPRQQTEAEINKQIRLERSVQVFEDIIRRFAGQAGQRFDFAALQSEIRKLVRAQEADARNAARSAPRSGGAGKTKTTGCQPADSITTLVSSGDLR